MRLSWWLALGAILLAAAVSPAGAEPARPLRVVTYNLFHGGASSGLSGDGHGLDARLEMVVRELRAQDPDVIGLQEAPAGRGLDVFSTHTSRDACQHRHVAELVVARRGPLPAVVMGDFNAAEGSPRITALTEGAGLVWQRVEVPASTVFRRVDYVFVLPGTLVPGRVRASRVVLDARRRFANGATLWPSDHYGVLAELELGTER